MAKKSTTSGGLSKKEIKELPWNTQEYRDAKYTLTQPVSEHRTTSAKQQDAMRTVGAADAARTRRIVETTPEPETQNSAYIQKLLKKNPDQEFSVFDKKAGKWVTYNKGMGGETTPEPNVNPGVQPTPTTPIVSRPPVAAQPLVSRPAPVVAAPVVAAPVSQFLPQQAGVPQPVVRQSSVAPVPYVPTVRPMAAVPQVTPKAVMSERMPKMGQRAEMGRDFSTRTGDSYSKNRPASDGDGLFKF